MKEKKSLFHYGDKVLFILSIVLACVGFVLFVSAATGIYADNNAKFYSMIFSQGIFLVTGIIGMIFTMLYVPHQKLRRFALPLFACGVLLCLLVFVPGLGFEHGGARRWINLGFTTLQTGEVMKFVAVLYCAGWYSAFRSKIHEWQFGLLPLLCILGFSGVLLLQPDTDTYAVLAVACVAIYVAAGGSLKDITILGLIGLCGIGILIAIRPYLLDRVMTLFTGVESDIYGAGYQMYQSLIAVGSGGLMGNGLGQSVQKFSYVPEPAGDSIFAIISEELGFIGASLIVIVFTLIFLRILYIAKRAESSFASFLALGIGVLILAQAAFNIYSMIGIIPLSGLPLPLISHGGTALLLTCIQIGIILNISKTIHTV